eukprot:scaffold2047_cov129-Cylindrotheca_fusiformis.AAC.49
MQQHRNTTSGVVFDFLCSVISRRATQEQFHVFITLNKSDVTQQCLHSPSDVVVGKANKSDSLTHRNGATERQSTDILPLFRLMNDFEESRRLLKSCRKEQRPLTIVLTGCSRLVFFSLCIGSSIIPNTFANASISGIGLQASKLLKAATPESKLFLVARSLEKARKAKGRVKVFSATSSSMENVVPMECDNTSLTNVRDFCCELREKLIRKDVEENRRGGIDVLCLNAAVLLGEDAKASFTEDDIEVTFQTNHLAPFLMANLLFDLINPGGRVVVTTSGLQAFCSFENFEGCRKGDRSKRRFEMVNRQRFHHKQSYAMSKLCNVTFCLALDRRLRMKKARAVCFTPGLIPSSGLFRHHKDWVATVMKKQAVGMDDTEEWGGCMLAWMALSDQAIQEDPEHKNSSTYWRATFGISRHGGKIPQDLFLAPVNEEAMKLENQELLWKLSVELARVQSHELSGGSRLNPNIDK